MSKVVFIKDNSPEIREKLKEAGFSICVCASFPDSIWLDYHPDESNYPFDIHGEGYTDKEDLDYELSPLERIQERLKTDWYYSKEREFYNTVEEFLEHYSKVVSDQPSEIEYRKGIFSVNRSVIGASS